MNTVKYIALHEMEQITESILQDYGLDLEQGGLQPIPIEEIIEFHYELDIVWERIDHFDPEGIVMAAIIPSERKIIMNESHKQLFGQKIGTFHFTLAHELGHWVLHAGENGADVLMKSLPYLCRGSDRKLQVEVQADLFAGCILMPERFIRKAVRSMKLNGPVYMSHLYAMADLCKVSISALKVRLNQLNLLFIDKEGNITFHKKPQWEQLAFDI